MFTKDAPNGFLSPMDGIQIKTLAWGDKSMMTRFHLKKGSLLPKHSHPHEQTGFLVSGKIKLFIDGKEYVTEPGDSWSIKGDIEHWAQIEQDSVAIEVFTPIREDYLPNKA